MSLGLHLTVLESGCAMPSITRQNLQINPVNHNEELSKSKQKNPTHLHCNGLLATKEYSLISHIESLKALANGNIPLTKLNHDDEKGLEATGSKLISSPSCQQSFPQIASSSHVGEHLDTMSPLVRPLSSKWATNPDLVGLPGNLRTNSEGKQVSLTLEEILSRGSSSMTKRQEVGGEHHYDEDDAEIAREVYIKLKRKSAKTTRKKSLKNKEASKSQADGFREGRRAVPSTHNAIRDIERKVSFNYSPSTDISSLTALCKGIKIQEKQPKSLSVKQVPYLKKTSTSTSHSHKTSSPFRSSLENAVAEYSKKTHVSTSDHRRKASRAGEENVKTTKIFLSEKQSGVISDCGASIPCAPPATPTADQLKRYEYVPSLQDIRSQRSFRQRLEMMETRALRKEKKKQAECMKQEKMSMREKRIELKHKQRQEIYALNELMTKLENDRFKQFMLNAGCNM